MFNHDILQGQAFSLNTSTESLDLALKSFCEIISGL